MTKLLGVLLLLIGIGCCYLIGYFESEFGTLPYEELDKIRWYDPTTFLLFGVMFLSFIGAGLSLLRNFIYKSDNE